MAAHAALCGRFSAAEDRAGANYVYRASDLATLPGRRYAKKRNLIAQFLELHPRWEAAPLDEECGPACRHVLLAMASGQGISSEDPSLRAELAALEFTIAHLRALEQDGLVLRIEGDPVAFSIYERLDAEVTAVHFEKADRARKGVFQMVNRESASTEKTPARLRRTMIWLTRSRVAAISSAISPWVTGKTMWIPSPGTVRP